MKSLLRWSAVGSWGLALAAAAWAVLVLAPRAEETYVARTGDVVPGPIATFLGLADRPFTSWVPLLVATVLLTGLAAFRRQARWPYWLAIGLATALLGYVGWIAHATSTHIAGLVRQSEQLEGLLAAGDLPELKRRLYAAIEDQTSRKCPRPPVRGEAAAGSAADDIRATLEDSEGRACWDQLRAMRPAIRHSAGMPQEDAPDTEGPPTLSEDDLESLRTECSGVIERLRGAIRHRDACSPYRPGLSGQAPSMRLLDLMSWIGVWSTRLAETAPSEAAELAVDGVRFCQDMARGGVGLLDGMVAAAAAKPLLRALHQLLDRPAALDVELLSRLEGELEALLASHPPAQSYFRGERIAMPLYTLLPMLESRQWRPPGGWGYGKERDDVAPEPAAPADLQQRIQAVFGWRALNRYLDAVAASCSHDQPPAACARALEQMAEAAPSSRPASIIDGAARREDSDEMAEALTEAMSAVLAEERSYPRCVDRNAAVKFRLQALRWHVRYRQLVESQRGCPEADAAMDAIGELTDPYSGRQLRVEPTSAGELTLHPGADISLPSGEPLTVTVTCPR